MRTSTRASYVLAAFIALILLLLLASRVGGIAIRRAPAAALHLEISTPVLPGVPTLLYWDDGDDESNALVVVYARDARSDYLIGQAELAAGAALVTFPCRETTARDEIISVVMTDVATQQVLGSLQVPILPPGQDCALGE